VPLLTAYSKSLWYATLPQIFTYKCVLSISMSFCCMTVIVHVVLSFLCVTLRESVRDGHSGMCCTQSFNLQLVNDHMTSLFPRPPRPAFVACSTKSRGRPGQTYHVMRATADVMFSLLTSGFVLSTLLSLNPVHSFCSVCPVRAIATGSIMASYST